jgi:hypothetical protein
MKPSPSERISSVLQVAISELTSSRLTSQLKRGLIAPVRERRVFQTDSGDAQGDIWIFFLIPGRDTALAYSEEGYGVSGMPWGLVFQRTDQYGSSGSWYRSLTELLEDSGYFDADADSSQADKRNGTS